MSLKFAENKKDFFTSNKEEFEKQLLAEAVNVKDKIEEIHSIGNINLLNNAYKLVLFVVEDRKEELESFAKEEGIAWAKHTLTLAFKLEWVQAIRRTLWRFLHWYEEKREQSMTIDSFFTTEKAINDNIDKFLNSFFISYSQYKDELIQYQRKIVEELSVPIIPISPKTSVLPLIGRIDDRRARTIEEKVFSEVGTSGIETLVLDLSGIAQMETEAINDLRKILDGIAMMGCKSVITGIRPELARSMVDLGTSLDFKAESKGTLQTALKDFFTENLLS